MSDDSAYLSLEKITRERDEMPVTLKRRELKQLMFRLYLAEGLSTTKAESSAEMMVRECIALQRQNDGVSDQPTSPIFIIFDGPPGPTSGRFIEVVDSSGKSIDRGEWIDRGDGYWALRLP